MWVGEVESKALELLLADVDIDEELSEVLLLNGSVESNVNANEKSNSCKKIKGKIRKRQKDELAYLQQKVNELTTHLDVIKQVKIMETSNSSPWESAARKQAVESHKATQENIRLKRALEEQLEIAEALKVILIKRPKLAVRWSKLHI